MRAGSLEQSFGDIEKIEIPDPSQYGAFVDIGELQGAVDRATSSLIGQYAADMSSELLKLARQRCALDVQVHFGACTNPRVFSTFTKALIFENAHLPSYSTDDLGALTSDENAKITETVDLSIGKIYEVLPLTFQERALDVVVSEIVDIAVCDTISCGDCDVQSEGCQKVFALQGGLTGSPGTAPDVIWTVDGGKVWDTDEINVLTSAQPADGIACLGLYIIVISNAAGSLSYKEKNDVTDGVVAGWVEVTTGFVAAHYPNDIWSVGIGAFVVGDGGYVYYIGSSPSDGVSVLDASVVVTDDLNAVHAISDEVAVAVGDAGAVIYTTNRYTWSLATAPSAGNLLGVFMKNEDEWWVVDDNGDVWYTTNQGVTWTEKSLPGTAPTALYDIYFPSASIGYISGTAGAVGAMWRTYDGGYSWLKLPEGIGTLPGSSTVLNALGACEDDVNFVVAGGMDASSTPVGEDGVLIVGEE